MSEEKNYDYSAYNDEYENQLPPDYENVRLTEEEYNAKLKYWENNRPKRQNPDHYVKLLLEVLNNEPPQIFIETLKVGWDGKKKEDRTMEYIPIDKIIFLLYRTFSIYWRKEVLRGFQMLNSSATDIRLHFKVPNTNIWSFHDGQGAKEFQVDAEKTDEYGNAIINPTTKKPVRVKASQLEFIKSNAVMLAYPSSGSYALSNAASNLGALFGSNLNRKNPVYYMGSWDPDAQLNGNKNQDNQPKTDSDGKQNNSNSSSAITADQLEY